MVTWDNFLRGITQLLYFKPTSASFYFSNEIWTIYYTTQGQPWPDWLPPLQALLSRYLHESGPQGASHLLTFLCHELTAYSFRQWRSLPHQWTNRLPLSCHGSCLCLTSSHSESLRSLISLLWHLFKAALCCGYLDICVVKRGPSPKGDDSGFILFFKYHSKAISILWMSGQSAKLICALALFSEGGFLAKVSNSLCTEIDSVCIQ